MNQVLKRSLQLAITYAISVSAGATTLSGPAIYQDRIAISMASATPDSRKHDVTQNASPSVVPDSPLRNTYWKLVTLQGKPVSTHEQQREAHIVFAAEGDRLSGSSGCNRMMGGFEQNEDQLKMQQIGGTRMACANGMEQEAEFLQTLLLVEKYRIQGDHLDMLDANGLVVAGFDGVALQ